MTEHKFKNKKILVVGMGRSGMAAVRVLNDAGAAVSVQDSKTEEKIDEEFADYVRKSDIKCYFGVNPSAEETYDTVVISPGVPPDLKFVDLAKEKGAEIIGELELAYRMCRGKFVAITGTNGKTTTTTLVGEIFKNQKRDTVVAGNIGRAVITDAVKASEDTWMVTEVSSFQLETVRDFRPVVAAMLNLTPDHMNRHKTMENYGRTKARIFMNQKKKEYAVLNFDDGECFSYASSTKATIVPFSRIEELKFGAYVKDETIVIKDHDGKLIKFCGTDELKIPGAHNLENALAAVAISYFAGIDPEVITKTLKTFEGVEHRIEFCGEWNGIKFVNDSKGTNTDAAVKAIEAISGGIVLIAGGYDKGSEFDDLIAAFGSKVKHAVLMGQTAAKIKQAAEKAGFDRTTIVKDMEDCIEEACRLAEHGDTVLLSPACASWDMYDDFEQRGRHFKECVRKLEK